MKTHARVEVRKTGEKDENRDLEHGKVFRKNQKKRVKNIFSVVLHAYFLRFSPLSRPAYTVPAPLSRRSVPPCRALCPADLTADRVHQAT